MGWRWKPATLATLTACGGTDRQEGWRDNLRATAGFCSMSRTTRSWRMGCARAAFAHGCGGNLSISSNPGAACWCGSIGAAAGGGGVHRLAGFARGLALCGDYAVITVSLPRWRERYGAVVAAEMRQRGGGSLARPAGGGLRPTDHRRMVSLRRRRHGTVRRCRHPRHPLSPRARTAGGGNGACRGAGGGVR